VSKRKQTPHAVKWDAKRDKAWRDAVLHAPTYESYRVQEALAQRRADDLADLRECLAASKHGWRQKMIAARIRALEGLQAGVVRLAGKGGKSARVE
jgi:hypothetical protein